MREGWKKVRLGDVCAIQKTKHNGDPLPYVGLEHIESDTGRFVGSIAPLEVRSSTFRFSPYHVLYGRLRPYLNKVMLPNFEGHCSSEIFPLKPSEALDRRFLYYWITQHSVVKEIDKTSTGARMPRANVNQVMGFDLILPPVEEQKRIVAILDEAFEGIDTVVANTKRNFANMHELYASSLGRVFSEANVETWEKAEIKDAVAEDCSLSYGIVQPGEGFEDGMPIVRPTDLTKKLVGLKGLKLIDPSKAASYSRTTLEGGDLLLCVRGNTGMVSIAGDELAGGNVTRGIVPVRFNPELVSQSFGYYLLVSPMVQEQVKEKTYGAALMQINIRDLRRLRLAFPEIEDQRSMVKKLDDISAEVKRLEAIYQQKLTALAELKQSLLQKAFSGELTAKQAETAVAEAAA